ncbi:MAG: CotH kinase family protein [Fibrobacterales bacterium]
MIYILQWAMLMVLLGLTACGSDNLSTAQSDTASSEAMSFESSTAEVRRTSSEPKTSTHSGVHESSNSIDSLSSDAPAVLSSSADNVHRSSEKILSSSEVPMSSTAALSKRENLRHDLEYIFDETDAVKTYEIIIDTKALARLDAAPKMENYEYAHLVFKGDTIRDIQVRYKGSFGAWADCTSGEMGSPEGEKTCIKLALKLKINSEKHSDRLFFGMKKLIFHHMHFYRDQMKERLSYWMHRQMGSIAPRAVHAKIKINGKLIGLFTHVEYIDGRFTRDRFKDGEGNVYKEIIPLKYDMVTPSPSLNYVLKTNEDEDPTHEIWQSLERDVLEANEPARIKAVIRKNMDVPSLVSSVLTSMAIMHWDSPFVRDDGHNSYWYADTLTGKLYTIPWDMDNADFIPRMAPFWGGLVEVEKEARAALACNSQHRTNKIAQHWLCFPEASEALDKLLDEVYPQVNTKLDEWAAQIEPAHKQARAAHQGTFPETGALTMKEWKNTLNTLKETIEKGRKVVKGWR